MSKLPVESLESLFTSARTHNAFLPDPVSEDELRALWELTRLAPTSANTNPLRIAFVRTPEAKERLRPALAPANVEKTMSAPVTAILAWDGEYYDQLPRLFPHYDMRSMLLKAPDRAVDLGRNNAWLQAGYFILAARSLGLDTGPMGGFDSAIVDREFFTGTTWHSILLVNLGHGDPARLFPRNPRLTFEEATTLL